MNEENSRLERNSRSYRDTAEQKAINRSYFQEVVVGRPASGDIGSVHALVEFNIPMDITTHRSGFHLGASLP